MEDTSLCCVGDFYDANFSFLQDVVAFVVLWP